MKLVCNKILAFTLLPLALLFLSDCTTTKGPGPGEQPLKLANGCITGLVLDSKGNGVPSVNVITMPETTTEVTDKKGFFEICEQRKVVDASIGRTVKAPLGYRSYKLFVGRQGFKSQKSFILVKYHGKNIHLKVLITERGAKLGETQTSGEDKPDDTKRDPATGNKPPTGS